MRDTTAIECPIETCAAVSHSLDHWRTLDDIAHVMHRHDHPTLFGWLLVDGAPAA